MNLAEKSWFLYLTAALYIGAGVAHFLSPEFFLKIMPLWAPYPEAAVAVSGAVEIALGVALIPRVSRRYAARLIIAMLVVFLVIHVDMVWRGNPSLAVALIRLPFQALLIWQARVFAR